MCHKVVYRDFFYVYDMWGQCHTKDENTFRWQQGIAPTRKSWAICRITLDDRTGSCAIEALPMDKKRHDWHGWRCISFFSFHIKGCQVTKTLMHKKTPWPSDMAGTTSFSLFKGRSNCWTKRDCRDFETILCFFFFFDKSRRGHRIVAKCMFFNRYKQSK